MNDYISRQAAIDAIRKVENHAFNSFYKGLAKAHKIVADLPSADVAPVVHGRWLPIVSYNNTYKCSECGRLLMDITDGLKMVAKHYPYCHCGAKMHKE